MKTKKCEMENTLAGIKNRFHFKEEQIIELEDITRETV